MPFFKATETTTLVPKPIGKLQATQTECRTVSFLFGAFAVFTGAIILVGGVAQMAVMQARDPADLQQWPECKDQASLTECEQMFKNMDKDIILAGAICMCIGSVLGALAMIHRMGTACCGRSRDLEEFVSEDASAVMMERL